MKIFYDFFFYLIATVVNQVALGSVHYPAKIHYMPFLPREMANFRDGRG